jgi:hypothetical protein
MSGICDGRFAMADFPNQLKLGIEEMEMKARQSTIGNMIREPLVLDARRTI